MKVKEIIESLSAYNSEAEFIIVVNNKQQKFTITFGSSEGCAKKNCEHVSFYVDKLCTNEK